MWPWTHLALGYLVVSLVWRLRGRRVDGAIAVVVAVGSQFPDLVDKPLAWYLGVLPAGRSLAHSAFTAAAVAVVVLTLAVLLKRLDAGLGFVLAYWSHLLGDVLPKLSSGDYESLTFLLWPVLPLPEYGGADSVADNLAAVAAEPATYLLASPSRVAVLGAVLLLWCADGLPGLADVGRYLTRSLGPRSD